MRDEFYCMSFLLAEYGEKAVEWEPGTWVWLSYALANENNV